MPVLVLLESASAIAKIAPDTGQLLSLTAADSLPLGGPSFDRYAFGAQTSDERHDVVVSAADDGDGVTLVCTNDDLGLRLHKRYELRDRLLVKTVGYESDREGRTLLQVSSEATIDPSVWDDGFLYTPIDDGYKITTAVPLVSGKDIVKRQSRFIAGMFVYYLPHRSTVFAHYRYGVDGHHFFSDGFWQGSSIQAELFPGGAVTALGQGYLEPGEAVTLTSHYAVLDGDPRAYHRHVLSLPPFDAYRGVPTASWFTDARMLFGELGTGRALIENTEAVLAEVQSYLDVLDADQPVMVFFNHWSTSGDYPFEGTFRYGTYDLRTWSDPIDISVLMDKIAQLKALSSRVKVGGYFISFVAEAARAYADHPEWMMRDAHGDLVAGGDGVGPSTLPDFGTPYADFTAQQMTQCLETVGFDWLHIDFGPFEGINFAGPAVTQSWQSAAAFERVGTNALALDKSIVENSPPTTYLWSDGGYFECAQPDRWEKRDWRGLAAPGHLAALARTHRPGTWWNLVYGCSGMYGLRNAATGLRGWIRGADALWRGVPQANAYESVVDELLRTTVSEAIVSPSWWRLEDDVLEAEGLAAAGALIISLVRHAGGAGTHTVTVDPVSAGLDPELVTFGVTLRLMRPDHLDAYAPVPASVDVVELLSVHQELSLPGEYAATVELEGRRNYYHVVSQVPAAVARSGGVRPRLLLPVNRGVAITGCLRPGDTCYTLEVDSGAEAEILAYLPEDWSGADASLDGSPCASELVALAGARGLLVAAPPGRHSIDIRPAKPAGDVPELAPTRVDAWATAARLLTTTGAVPSATTTDGRSCLTWSGAGATASVDFRYAPAQPADGVAFCVKGTGSGARIAVSVLAHDHWTATVVDDSAGWRDVVLDQSALSSDEAAPTWASVHNVRLAFETGGGDEITIADVRLLPSTAPPAVAPAKRRVTAAWTDAPPLIDGHPTDRAWDAAPETSSFFSMGTSSMAESMTFVKVCYDAEALYVLFVNVEPLDAVGDRHEGLQQIWSDDHVEVFVQPPSTDWFQFMVDPAGSREWHHHTEWGMDSSWAEPYAVETSLNWQASWVAEFAIPFSSVGATPMPGDVWRINFARKDLSNEYSNWATPGDWLDPDGFGYVEFGAAPSDG